MAWWGVAVGGGEKVRWGGAGGGREGGCAGDVRGLLSGEGVEEGSRAEDAPAAAAGRAERRALDRMNVARRANRRTNESRASRANQAIHHDLQRSEMLSRVS